MSTLFRSFMFKCNFHSNVVREGRVKAYMIKGLEATNVIYHTADISGVMLKHHFHSFVSMIIMSTYESLLVRGFKQTKNLKFKKSQCSFGKVHPRCDCMGIAQALRRLPLSHDSGWYARRT